MGVTYTAVLPVREETAHRLAALLDAERARRGTRASTGHSTSRDQAIMALRWFYDGTRMKQLAADNQISVSTAMTVPVRFPLHYAPHHEGANDGPFAS